MTPILKCLLFKKHKTTRQYKTQRYTHSLNESETSNIIIKVINIIIKIIKMFFKFMICLLWRSRNFVLFNSNSALIRLHFA